VSAAPQGPTLVALSDLVALDDEQVLDTRLSWLGDAVDEPQRLGIFTDEELLVLDGAPEPATVPTPWTSRLADGHTDTALSTALRGLLARGMVHVEQRADDAGVEVAAAPEIFALLTMRRHVTSVVVGERHVDGREDYAVLHEQRAGMWLIEYVDHRGLHEFVLATAEVAAAAMTVWCGAVPDRPVPGLDVTLTREQLAERPAELDQVAAATAAVTITRIDLSDPPTGTWSGVYTGPDGHYLSVATPQDALRYVGADHAAVLEHWAATLGAPA
jgi:hypothetical protein